MGCNCGDNEYRITVDNNGNCEPTTPIYNITLANVGVNGYSPIVRFINETVESFNIAVDNITGTETSPAVPKLSYVADQINDINTTIAGLSGTYLTKDGSNADNPITLNGLSIREQYGNTYINTTSTTQISSTSSIYVTGSSLELYGNAGQIRILNNYGIYLNPSENKNIYLNPSGTGKVYYNSTASASKEVATKGDIPTVGNGTITITQGGVTKGTFTTNQSGNSTIEIEEGGSNYTAGNGINISNDTISIASNVLQNTATGTSSLTVLGNSSDEPYTINIGNGSYANYAGSVVIGYGALSNGYNNISIGIGAKCKYGGDNNIAIGANAYVGDDTISVNNAYQIGTGTNLTSNSLAIGYRDDNLDIHNYQLLDLTTGKIPNDRINTMVGATTLTGGSAGLVPAPTTSDAGKYLRANGTWSSISGSSITPPLVLMTDALDMIALGFNTNTSPHSVYMGVQNSQTGYQPLKLIYDSSNPISLTDDPSGHGTSKIELNYNTNTMGLDSSNKLTVKEMTGSDSITAGTSGLVPAPSAGDEDKFLKGDGSWDTVGGGSSYTAGTGIDITNDTISTSSTVMTTDTAQTVTQPKTFDDDIHMNGGDIKLDSTSSYIQGKDSNNTYRNIIARSIGSSTIAIGNTEDVLTFKGSGLHPIYNNSDIALVADVPTVYNSTITFTQGGVTKGTITLNQSSNATIALDAGSIPSVIDGGNA